ncbi:alanine racemase [Natribacillus halophilus]|uniref:Alanine racemase n=1 Tax=Natribacillus halophilus TaxID=549003 RepID=A0A1G8QIW8_9BACI|nr:alanine racemase [Natribacillus halophilus]SDJ04608.1 alanine racemase [Natribacillus halophilus]
MNAYQAGQYRDTWIEIDLEAIADNVKAVQALHDTDINVMAVVKADGYGHGATQVARAAIAAGAQWIGVALLEEAVALREAGIQVPILVLGRINPRDANVAQQYKISVTAFQKEWLAEAKTYLDTNTPLNVHMKCDTGMGRIGLTEEQTLLDMVKTILMEDAFHLEGIFTHLATADEWATDYLERQLKYFQTYVKLAKETAGPIPYVHYSNSAASLRYPGTDYNMIRFGISMYGLVPAVDTAADIPVSLLPAMSLHSRLVHVKKVAPSTSISYGATYQASEEEWIGTVPIGYGDGWLRANATNGGEVLVEGERCPIVGRICMDQMMVRLPKELPVGTKVTLIGQQKEEKITIEEVAQRLSTITYEIPCTLNNRIPRYYYPAEKQ